MMMLAQSPDQSFVEVERIRRIAEYDRLLPRLARLRANLAPQDRTAVIAAESVLYRVVRGPLSMEDVQIMRDDVSRLELARRLEGTGVTVNALHPGLVATNFLTNNGPFGRFLNFFLSLRGISVEAGAITPVYAASSPEMEGVSGKYLVRNQLVKSSKHSYDESMAAALWELSASLTGIPSATPKTSPPPG